MSRFSILGAFFFKTAEQHHMIFLQAWFYVDLSIYQCLRQFRNKRASLLQFLIQKLLRKLPRQNRKLYLNLSLLILFRHLLNSIKARKTILRYRYHKMKGRELKPLLLTSAKNKSCRNSARAMYDDRYVHDDRYHLSHLLCLSCTNQWSMWSTQ